MRPDVGRIALVVLHVAVFVPPVVVPDQSVEVFLLMKSVLADPRNPT